MKTGGKHGVKVLVQDLTCMVDNTFASLTVSPARWGVDVVVQSLTKYTSGSGDIVAGEHSSHMHRSAERKVFQLSLELQMAKDS
jgi:cystathionine beta-lyase/cystathionine gamma-synthase